MQLLTLINLIMDSDKDVDSDSDIKADANAYSDYDTGDIASAPLCFHKG